MALLWLAACVIFGLSFTILQESLLIGVFAVALLLVFNAALRRRIQLWRACILVSLTGFIILNYGFENFVAGHVGGVPLLVGEMLMFAGLALGFRRHNADARALFRDPAMKCMAALWVLATLHLISEVPQFGLYAFRDASIFFEAIFLLAGFLWTMETGSLRTLERWLLLLFIANLAYSCTLPFGETLQQHSPSSGVFQPIALLGQYQHNNLYVVAGAFFCIWMAPYVVKWKRWMLVALAAAQLGTLVILQTRSMYIGIVLIAVMMVLIGEWRKFAQIVPVVGCGIAAVSIFVVVVSALGIGIHGRVMDIRGTSLREHAETLFSVTDEHNRLGQDEDRLDWIHQVWTNTVVNTGTLFFGQGFGKPLIDFERDGIPVRQPHNSTLGVFGRLGVLGVAVWLLFHGIILRRLVKFIRHTRGIHEETRDFIVWLLAFYVLALVLSMVQPTLEFSHCAVPLYFLLGVGLSIARPVQSREATVSMRPVPPSPQLAA